MKKLLLFMFAALAFVACEQAPIEEQSAIRQDTPETITVGFEGDDTRIQLNKAQKTVWNSGDEVSVFYRSNGNQKWQYKGEDGVRQATLSCVQNATGSTSITKTVVVYPYDETYWLNTDSYCIEATTPATQHYAVDSYGVGDNLMVSQGEFTQFSLKNVYGWLKLQLTGDGETIKSIKFRGNNGEQVAGLIYVDTATAEATLAAEMGSADDNNAGGNLVFEDTILTEVTLDCGEGVELLPVVTAFYIAIPPQTFEKGFTVEITDNSDYTMVQSTSKKQVIERNHIQPMAAFEFINPTTPATPKPANNEIWYTATAKVEPIWDDAETFGANLKSNTWDSASGSGVYTFSGDVTMVGDGAFSGCKLKGITLPESVTKIGTNAFKNCDSLKDVTFGNSVEIIKSCAFYDCDALQQIIINNSITTIENEAFCECDALTSVLIGDGLTKIGDYVFAGCDKLKEFKGKYASDDCRALVMDGVLLAYADASGSEYEVPNYVTSIYHDAFKNCKKLTKITISDSVTNIGESAFYDCAVLATANIGNSVTSIEKNAFYSCNKLSEVTLGSGVQEIGENAFRECTMLPSITLPENVTLIGYNAFKGCTSLKKIYSFAVVPPTLKVQTIGYGYWPFDDGAEDRRIYVYSECVNVYKREWGRYSSQVKSYDSYSGTETTTIYYTTTDGEIINSDYLSIKENTYADGQGKMVVCGKLDMIPNNAFSSQNNLTSVTIPDSVTTIGNSAFYNSTSLTSVTIPDSVTTIGNSAFYNCTSLTSVTIPNSVVTIGSDAFNDCDGITSVTIPDSVMDIGLGAFGSCGNLTEFKGKFAVDGGDALVVDNKFIAFAPKSSKVDYVIPSSVTTVGNSAFEGCNLINITIPDGVIEIGDRAFHDCKLTSVTIPDNVTYIGSQAYSNCENLINVTVGSSVQNIGSWAFSYCSDQLTVNMKPTVPPTLEDYVFDGWYDSHEEGYLKIYVPVASEYAYKSAWSTWAGYMYPYDFDRVQTNYEIWYTSKDEVLVSPDEYYCDANIISNVYKNSVGVISFDREITTIGESMFSGQDKLLSISLPESITSIGDNAFSSCWNLSSVNIPDSVTTIGNYAFDGCNLAYITIPDGVTEIGDRAFYDCEFTSVTIPDSVMVIGKQAFSGWYLENFKGKFASEDGRCLIVDGVLNSFAPADITSYVIPNSVTEIGDYAFYGCDNLKSVTIPDSVTTIGCSAFRDCDYLTNVTIPNSVTTIGEQAFSYCRSITSVNIPASLTTFDYNPFYGCNNLEEFTGMYAADGGRCVIKDNTIIAYASASGDEYVIPAGVIKIGNYAFGGSNITKVTIPNSVTTIGVCAFFGCHSICEVYCKSTTPPIYSSQAFDATPAAKKFYVPMSSVDAYKTASGWKMYSDKIVGYDFENGVVVE